jgi:hypothetical protein
LHVSVSVPQLPHAAIRVALGAHTGVLPHEQAPHAQPPEQVSLPYVLHPCVALGAQTPCPAQLPETHWPQLLQVLVWVPQLPHATGFVAPGVHAGVLPHEHAPHAQVPEQVSVPYVLHPCVAFGLHEPCPPQDPLTH